MKCFNCGKEDNKISNSLCFCLSCIRKSPEKIIPQATKVHKTIRKKHGLPPIPPKNPKGIQCNICANECKIGINEIGYCGLRKNINGKLIQPEKGLLYTYFDSLPTNCCAAWFCPTSNEVGNNLAVFPFGCTFDCLFCQNYEHKFINIAEHVSVDEFVKRATKSVCICYFGGTPEPQLPFLLKATKKILETKKVKICWEWNGSGNPNLVKKAAEYTYKSDGIIKFDLKAYDENLHLVLTGSSNKRTFQNFSMIANEYQKDKMLTATTLLVPGYIDKKEVGHIAKFISELNPNIPYSLLVFHPDYKMIDLPITSKKLAFDCYIAAKKYLKNVNIGNKHLLMLNV